MPLPRQNIVLTSTGTAGGSGEVVQNCFAGGSVSITTVWRSGITETVGIRTSYYHRPRHEHGAILALAILFSLTFLALVVVLCCICQRSRSKKSTVNIAQGNQEMMDKQMAHRGSRNRKGHKNSNAATDDDSTVVAYGGRRHRRRDGRPVKHYDEEVESEGDASSFIAGEEHSQFPGPAVFFPPIQDHHEMQVPTDPQAFNAPMSRAAERKVELMNDASEVGSSHLEVEHIAPSEVAEGRRRHSKTSESLARGKSRRG
ncbi:hypothetical protein BDZ45DRAFT_313284 [Acephala macrosclerotiorum]|nr:hypothetical protein BDZ45DRAFT_313284 [Acephala macrosclerotiorum]